jgi:ABC-2 type transport system ATP-binding protein
MDPILHNNILQVDNVNVFYGNFQAVSNVSFYVKQGEIFGLLGPNGTGKTSVLSAIEGLIKQQSGTVLVAGYDTLKHPLDARAAMGVQLQATSFQPELNVSEILQ